MFLALPPGPVRINRRLHFTNRRRYCDTNRLVEDFIPHASCLADVRQLSALWLWFCLVHRCRSCLISDDLHR